MTKYHLFSALTAKKQALAFLCMMCLAATSLWAQQAQLTISTDDSTQILSTKVYDGSTVALVTHVGAAAGLLPEHPYVTLYANANYLTPDVGGIKMVIVTYSIGSTDSAYYLPPQNDTLFASITPKQLTITGTAIDSNKVYNGGTLASITSVGTLYGVIGSEDVHVSAFANYEDPNVGTNKNVTVSFMLYGNTTQCANYLPPADITLTANITPRQLYAPIAILQRNKVYDGTIICNVESTSTLEGVLPNDTVSNRATASFLDPNVGNDKPVNIYHFLSGPQSGNYTITDTSNYAYTANILPRKITVEGGIAQLVKEYDGTRDALVLIPCVPTNLVNGDDINLITHAYYDTPEPGENKTITFQFTLLNSNSNYQIPDEFVYSTVGKIIIATLLDTTVADQGFAIDSKYICPDDEFTGTFTILQGTPTYYSLIFDEAALAQGFTNTTKPIVMTGPNTFNVSFDIPQNCAAGTYNVTFAIGNEVNREISFPTQFVVNLSNTYLVQVFNDVISIDNRNNTFNTYQWYLNDTLIEGATKPYYQDPRGYLDGFYSLLVNKGTDNEYFVCPKQVITYAPTEAQKSIVACPNPVVNTTKVKLTGFGDEQHLLTVFNSYGLSVVRTTFNGQEYEIDMTAFPQGTYMINVDGITTKTVKF